MIQDISPAVFDGAFHDYTPEDSTPIFCFWKNTVLLSCCNALPTYGQLRPFLTGTTYLFAIDQTAYYLGTLPDRLTLPGFTWLPHRTLRRLTPMSQTLAGFTAWHLAHWYQDNRFCGRCGQPMTPAAAERKLICPACGYHTYPRINPSVIIAVHDSDRILLSRYANRPVTWYVLLAGFIEVGETAEQCVAREVREETGLRVKNIRYYGSQPWGLTGGLSLAYTAELDGSDELRVDADELAEARWFRRDEVPVNQWDRASVTQDMMRAFVAGKF